MLLKNHWKWLKNYNLSGCTLVIPSVAVGNVGQLACDLLITSMAMEKIASIYTPAQIPLIGYDPYDLNSAALSSSCELYMATSRNLLVLQMRAPLIYKYTREFLEYVVDTFKEKNIRDVVILTSSYAHEKRHIMTSPFRYIASQSTPFKGQIENNNLIQHELQENELKIFGGGFAAMLFKISNEKSLPCLLLYKYCSEGDNVPDAYDMVNHLQQILLLFDKQQDVLGQLIQPASWNLLFGRPPPWDIY